MELRVLGCSGGIGNGHHTTSFLVDRDVLIDAGSGVNTLTMGEMQHIRHIFLTHSHLDHIHCVPLLVDTVFDTQREPVCIHALPDTIRALQKYIFNGVIWPDFSRLPHPERPAIEFVPMQPGERVRIGSRSFEMIPVNHLVPAVGYRVEGPTGAFAFSGDTTTNDTFWAGLNAHARLDLLIVESAFSNDEMELCRLSRHYCPKLLAEDLQKLVHTPVIYLTHAKPGEEEKIYDECRAWVRDREVRHLSGGEVFTV